MISSSPAFLFEGEIPSSHEFLKYRVSFRSVPDPLIHSHPFHSGEEAEPRIIYYIPLIWDLIITFLYKKLQRCVIFLFLSFPQFDNPKQSWRKLEVDFNSTTLTLLYAHPPRGARYSYPPEISIESCRIFTVAASGKSLWCR